ncbi:MAG: hybrid sensor histidine kinase/response regulator, partial [Pseudomonadota bacterium]
MTAEDQIARLERRVARERAARKRAEGLLEEKSRSLYQANQHLENASARLNQKVLQRTLALDTARATAEREAEFLAMILESIT